jgi:hypothetical protein
MALTAGRAQRRPASLEKPALHLGVAGSRLAHQRSRPGERPRWPAASTSSRSGLFTSLDLGLAFDSHRGREHAQVRLLQ